MPFKYILNRLNYLHFDYEYIKQFFPKEISLPISGVTGTDTFAGTSGTGTVLGTGTSTFLKYRPSPGNGLFIVNIFLKKY